MHACFYPETLPPVLVYAGQELRGFLIRGYKRGGLLSVVPALLYERSGGIPAVIREY